jgi:hypothetical protein
MVSLLLALNLATVVSSESTADARHIVQRAIEAQGGAEQIARLFRPWRAKVKGTTSRSLVITGELLHQSDSQGRISTTIGLGPAAIEVVAVTSGDKAWQSIAGITREVTGRDLEEMQDGQYSHRVQNLTPLLREPGFELSVLPEITVLSRSAVGIRVKSSGHRDIDLYFDKETGLLVKTESRILSPGKPPIVLEKILSDYRDFDGLKLPMKFTKYENRQLTSTEEFVELTFVDHIDDREFQKP